MISIIVPVYNTEKYLRECLDSILAQTYKDLEVILVDDGSKDSSLLICHEYASIDKRVRVYHKENSGVSDTRNFGIELAKGEFISFCDSDDKIDPELYQILYNAINEQDVDRVVCGYVYLYDGGKTLYSKPRILDGKYESNVILRKMIDDGTLSGFLFSGVNNSLFRRKIICENNLRFEPYIRYNEDSLFSFKYMLFSRSIYSLQSKPTYFYRQHDDSSTNKRTVGDKYKLLRQALVNMKLEKIDIDFEIQMKRRTVTEALWQVLDIAKKENMVESVRDIRSLLKNEELQRCITTICIEDLNVYKKVFFILMKARMPLMLFFLSNKLVPVLSRYLSR